MIKSDELLTAQTTQTSSTQQSTPEPYVISITIPNYAIGIAGGITFILLFLITSFISIKLLLLITNHRGAIENGDKFAGFLDNGDIRLNEGKKGMQLTYRISDLHKNPYSHPYNYTSNMPGYYSDIALAQISKKFASEGFLDNLGSEFQVWRVKCEGENRELWFRTKKINQNLIMVQLRLH